MRVIIIGGDGFIGKNIVRYLHANQINTVVLGRTCVDYSNRYSRYVRHDYSDINYVENLLHEGDCVIALAWSNVPVKSGLVIPEDIQSNVINNVRLFEACVNKKVNRILYMSSGGTVYGKPLSIPIKETHPNYPNSVYGINKLFVEHYLSYITSGTQTRGITIRLSNPFGPYQKPFTGQGIVATYLASAKLDMPIEIWGDGTSERDYIYIEDVVSAIFNLLLYEGKEHLFNIGSGKGCSINEIARMVEVVTGKKLVVQYKPESKVEVQKNILDYSLIARETGWYPIISISEGMRKMLNGWNFKTKSFEVVEE